MFFQKHSEVFAFSSGAFFGWICKVFGLKCYNPAWTLLDAENHAPALDWRPFTYGNKRIGPFGNLSYQPVNYDHCAMGKNRQCELGQPDQAIRRLCINRDRPVFWISGA